MSEDREPYWAEVEEHLKGLHQGNPTKLEEWLRDVDSFVDDHMELVRAAYGAGYLDALEDSRESLLDLERKFVE